MSSVKYDEGCFSRFQGVWQGNFFDFLRMKIISSVKMKGIQGFSDYSPCYLYEQEFICNLMFGNLINNSGDILLCPISECFKPSNPLSRKIIRLEGKWLEKEIESIYMSKRKTWIGSEHVAFFPCRKLKYRGILFVCVDFYSNDRVEKNIYRIAEAFKVAAKYNCARLACPKNFLYEYFDESNMSDFDIWYRQIESVVRALSDEIKISFIVDIVIQKSLNGYRILRGTYAKYDFRTAVNENIPQCAEILPHYRKRIKHIRTVYSISDKIARMVRQLLTFSITGRRAKKCFDKLVKYFGDYYESSVVNGNEGMDMYLLGICQEMPWNKDFLQKELESWYAEQVD